MCEVSQKQHDEMMMKYKENPLQLIPSLKKIQTLRKNDVKKLDLLKSVWPAQKFEYMNKCDI